MQAPYLEIGKIVNTHGVAGGVKVEPWCDSPAILAGIKTLYRKNGNGFVPFRVTEASHNGKFVLLHPEGVNDFDAANALRGLVLYAAREDVPCPIGSHFVADLIGLPVRDADTGRVYGTIRSVDLSGRHDLYVIDTPSGEVLFPAVSQFVAKIDPDDAIEIRPIPGFFDGNIEEVAP